MFGFTVETYIILARVPVLYALFFIDLKTMRLPDPLMFVFAFFGILFFAVRVMDADYLVDLVIKYVGGAFLYGVFAYVLSWGMTMILKKPALGFGDVKFFAIAGGWLGAGLLPDCLMLSGALGVLLGGIWMLIDPVQKTAGSVFPFGPALIVSFLTLLFYHDGVLNFILLL